MNYIRPSWETEEHSMFRESTRRFIEKEFVPNRERWIEQGYMEPEYWQKAGETGLLCPDVPVDFGGGGGDFGFDAITYEEAQRGCITSFGNAIQSIVAHYLLRYGTEDQKIRWLPKMATGEIITAIAMTEPGTGSDLQGVKTRAVRDGDDYLLTGSKIFITNGFNADLVCVVCKTDPEQGAKGTSLLMVETKDLDGFSKNTPLKKIGMKGQDTCELFFDNCRIPAGNLVGGEEGQGFFQLMAQLPRERLMIAVGAIAGIEAALEEAISYTKERKAFGKAIADFQNTKFKLAEMATEARIGRVFVDDCIEKLNAGTLDTETASMAKWWCTEKQFETANKALQLHGGYGYMMEYPIAHYFADSRVQMIYGGTNEIMKEVISRSL